MARLAFAAAGAGLVVALAGCGAGQITQTDTQQSAINGATGQVGPIALREVELKAPSDPKGVYQPGSTAQLILTIVNTGLTPDTLTSVSTPAALGVSIDGSPTGTKTIPGGFAVSNGTDVDGEGSSIDPQAPSSSGSSSGSPSETSSTGSPSTPPSSGSLVPPNESPRSTPTLVPNHPLLPGKISIELTGIKSVNGAPLGAGETIPVTFVFAHAGQVTIEVPIAAPSDSAAGSAAQSG